MFLTVTLVASGVVGAAWVLARFPRPPRIEFDRSSGFPNTTPVVVALTNRLPKRDRHCDNAPRHADAARCDPGSSTRVSDLLAQAVETLRMTRRSFVPRHCASFTPTINSARQSTTLPTGYRKHGNTRTLWRRWVVDSGAYGRLPTRDMWVKVESPGETTPPRAIEAENWITGIRSVQAMDVPGVGVAPFIILHLFDRELAHNA